MITHIRTTTAATIRSSLPLMESKREAFEAAMNHYLSQAGPVERAKGRHRLITGAITDMLFDHAARASSAGKIGRIDRHGIRHRGLGIGGEYYSSFGDGLRPVMRDVLGGGATPAMLAAWTDTYWATTRMVAVMPAALVA
jgi:hemoglobin-like flavoprotein